METKINEIFASIQGEGPYVGYRQLFIRFCNCNLNCNYCDTKFKDGKIYSPELLYREITNNFNLEEFHSISLTGGEPLISYEFLREFLPLLESKTKIYLETNATLTREFNEIKPYVDIISADIKLMSATGYDTLALHKNFFENCADKETFAKVVFDENITEDEIQVCSLMSSIFNIPLILQPKTIADKISVSADFCDSILEKFNKLNSNVRLIPQVHKFLEVK